MLKFPMAQAVVGFFMGFQLGCLRLGQVQASQQVFSAENALMTFFLAQTASYASTESGGSSSLMLGMLIMAVTLLGIMVVVLFNMSGRLRRLEIRLLQGTGKTSTASSADEDTAIEIETSPGGAFETFLKEDPERRKLPKREQFTAYRNWRKTNGLNWSDS